MKKHFFLAQLICIVLLFSLFWILAGCTDRGDSGGSGENWPQDMIDAINAMDQQQLRDFISQSITDAEVLDIAQQQVAKIAAGYRIGSDETAELRQIIDIELSEVVLVAALEEQSEQPLYLCQPHFRIKMEPVGDDFSAGSLSIDSEGWVVDANHARHRLLLSQIDEGVYHYLGSPAFDLPLNQALRELLVDEPAEAADFSLYGPIQLTLGRQFGEYPWVIDGDMPELPQPQQIDSGDFAGADFYQVSIGPDQQVGDSDIGIHGQTVFRYYIVEETGQTYLYQVQTTDRYLAPAVNWQVEAEDEYGNPPTAYIGSTERNLLAVYGERIEEVPTMIYSEETSFCRFDKVYRYAPDIFAEQRLICFYLEQGIISGIELLLVLN